jgi:hypothetical protein
VIDEHDIRLLCSYRVDNLAPETHGDALRGICEGHSRLIPERDHDAFERAVSTALVELFGEHEADLVHTRFARRRTLSTSMPAAQAVLVAMHDERPDLAQRLLVATRRHYERGS